MKKLHSPDLIFLQFMCPIQLVEIYLDALDSYYNTTMRITQAKRGTSRYGSPGRIFFVSTCNA